MFKLIHDNKVVDILDRIIYVRYIEESERFVNTDKTSAHGVRGSDIRSVYILEGKQCPPVKDMLSVKLVQINKKEYDKLKDILNTQCNVENDTAELHTKRAVKIHDMSSSCNSAIIDGINVLLSDGKHHNFKLTIEDQLNLQSFRYQISKGATKIMFHETDKPVRWFTASDMIRIIDAADRHKNKHTTYYNLLKHCIHNMYNKDDIESIYYGIRLETLPAPKDVQLNLKEYNIV